MISIMRGVTTNGEKRANAGTREEAAAGVGAGAGAGVDGGERANWPRSL